MPNYRAYYQLAKPGIIYGNLLTALAGYLLASKGTPDIYLLVATLAGIALVIGSACVFNNVIDRDIDALMARTKDRELVTHEISPRSALIFGTVLGLLGLFTLWRFTNALTLAIGIVGFVSYVGLYTYSKRKTPYSTLLGSISGATSLVAGYTAVTGVLDSGALILFLIMAIWQMPHFYAIAIFRQPDYARAKLPVWPIARGVRATKIQMVAWILAFTLACSLLTIAGYTGYIYLVIMLGIGLAWLLLALRGFNALDDVAWARRVFRFSLIVLLVLSVGLSTTAWLI